MKLLHAFAALQLAGIAAASPLFIVTAIPDAARALVRRDPRHSTSTSTDDPFGFVSSFFDPNPTPTLQTLPPPAIASPTDGSAPTETPDSSTTESSAPTTTSDSSTESSAPTTTSDSSTSTTTSAAASTTITPPASTTVAAAPQTSTAASSSKSDDGNGIPTAGIVVIIVFGVIILGILAWAFFRYNPRTRAWWVARQEKKQDARTWREALDGPTTHVDDSATAAVGVSQLRQKALSEEVAGGGGGEKGTAPAQRKSVLQSFFAPAAAVKPSGDDSGVRRKPVNWGEPSPSTPSTRASFSSEKLSLAATAAPMGRGNSDRSAPPMPTPPQPSRLSMAAPPDFGLPPTMPAAAEVTIQKAKRGSDGVYRLN